MRIVPMGELFKRLEKLAVDNSPTILTAIGVMGTLTTAYLTGQATVKAIRMIENEYEDTQSKRHALDIMSAKDKAVLCWKLYIPAASTAVVTVAAIISANRIGSRRAAALAAAYSVSERAFAQYQEKVAEKIGEKKEQQIRDEIAQTKVDNAPPTVIIGEGRQLCHEAFTGRFFYSDMETIRKAENDINQRVLTDSYASLAELYELLALPQTSESSEVGWTLDALLRIRFSAIISEGRPCISIDYAVKPIRNFDRLL